MTSYYEKNKEKVLANSKAYYNSHKEQYQEYRKEYKKKNDQKLKNYDKERNKTLKRKYQLCKQSAKARKIPFYFSLEEYKLYALGQCFYCGQMGSEEDNLGIDRIDSTLNYEQNNCVPACSKCNYAKLEMNTQEFKEHIIKIYNHWVKNVF